VWILVIGLTTITLGFGIRLLRGAVLQLSNELEESAQLAGANWLGVMRRIVLPILSPAIANVWLWTFLHSFTALTVALMLYSGRNIVLPTAIYFRWETGEPATAAAMGVILMIVSISLTVWLYRFIRRGV
jgi:ABC-type Fe3+ transport system permease subunit